MNLVYMKTKIYLGILSLALGLSLASCSEDDDYTIHTTPILNESSVVTGSSDVTATTATLHATLSGLDGMDAGSYKTGFFYGSAQDNLPEDVQAAYDGSAFSAQLNGLSNNSTLYYQAYCMLAGQGVLQGRGEEPAHHQCQGGYCRCRICRLRFGCIGWNADRCYGRCYLWCRYLYFIRCGSGSCRSLL